MNVRKRILLPALLIISIIFSACGTQPAELTYESALKWVEESTLDENGNYAVSEELIFALSNTEFSAPKNIIYMIGDGMGENIIQATQKKYANDLYGKKLAINYLTKMGTLSTYSASDKITDSAAGGTALATGKKTSNYTVGMDTTHTINYKSVLELATEKGKSTGIIATKSVTDATPASFTAHVEDRLMQNAIAKQQLEKIIDGTLDLVLGGGADYYEFFGNEEAFEAAEENGMSYSDKWEDTLDDKLPLVGLYANDALNTTAAYLPTLAEMTDFALDKLSEDENGFFLMVEGSQIDTMAHDNKLDKEMQEMYYFDNAIAVAMRFVALHPDTVLIVTADHETGGLYFPEEGYGKDETHVYLSDYHTSINVPVYALGHGISALEGIMENTDIAGFVAGVLGEDVFEQESVVTKVYDGQTSGAIKLSFNENITTADILTVDISTQIATVQNGRALHLVLKNTGEEKVTLPALKLQTTSGASYDVVSQYAYIEGGETLDLTYVLPVELWQNDAIDELSSIQITYDTVADNAWKNTFGYNKEVAELEIEELSITERILEQ